MVRDSCALIIFNAQQGLYLGAFFTPTSRERNIIKPNGTLNYQGTVISGTPQRAVFTITGATNGREAVTVENMVSGDKRRIFRNPRGHFNNRNVRFPWQLDSSFIGNNQIFYWGAQIVTRT